MHKNFSPTWFFFFWNLHFKTLDRFLIEFDFQG